MTLLEEDMLANLLGCLRDDFSREAVGKLGRKATADPTRRRASPIMGRGRAGRAGRRNVVSETENPVDKRGVFAAAVTFESEVQKKKRSISH